MDADKTKCDKKSLSKSKLTKKVKQLNPLRMKNLRGKS